VADGSHLQLDRDMAEMLNGLCITGGTTADEGSGLSDPLVIEMVQCIIQNSGHAFVVLRDEEDVSIELGNIPLTFLYLGFL